MDQYTFPTQDGPASLPLISFWMGKPTEGFPPVVQFRRWCESIWFAFEKAREPLEVHCAMVSPGEMLQRGAVGLTKGFTRCAVILYAIIRTLMVQDGESMTEPEREFFTQCRGFKIEPGCDIKVSTSCCCGCPNPDTTHR